MKVTALDKGGLPLWDLLAEGAWHPEAWVSPLPLPLGGLS